MLDQNFAIAPLHDNGKLLSPFHQENGVFGRQFIKADGLQLAFVFNAVEVDMVKLNVAILTIDPAPDRRIREPG